MLPMVFGENLFDNLFSDSFAGALAESRRNPVYGKHSGNWMKTDVREMDNAYEIDMDLPSFHREDVQVELQNGYLTVRAAKSMERSSREKPGRYIRKERYSGQCSRSFYVGEQVQPEDVTAKFEDGILKLTFPKREKKQLPAAQSISIQ